MSYQTRVYFSEYKNKSYIVASERPLILLNCGFEDITFKNTFSGSLETYEKIQVKFICKIIEYL